MHPLMVLLHEGELSREQLKSWIVNRFYFQENVPVKDAVILSKCPEPDVRRLWISRLLRREGMQRELGDVEGWVELATAAGISRERLMGSRVLPGVRFAVDSYVNFARTSSWLEGVAASLVEQFAKEELLARIDAFKRHYSWVAPSGLKFFMSRLAAVDESNEVALGIVMKYCITRKAQNRAVSSAVFASDVNWSINDAIYMDAFSQSLASPEREKGRHQTAS